VELEAGGWSSTPMGGASFKLPAGGGRGGRWAELETDGFGVEDEAVASRWRARRWRQGGGQGGGIGTVGVEE
jgi:hypothetical protein